MNTEITLQDQITGDTPLVPVILKLAGPVILMMYLQGAYNIIDTIWVGQLLGKNALAGIATGGFVLWIVFGLTNLIAVGAAATISRRVGEGNFRRAEYIIAKGLLYGFVLSVIVGFLLWIVTPQLFRLMGTAAPVTDLGTSYLRVILVGAPVIFLSFILQRAFQSEGDTVTPMWLMGFSLLVNAILDPVLMLGLLGLPELGVAGAALATVISRTVMVILAIWLLLKKKKITSKRLNTGLFRYIPNLVPVLLEGRLKLRVHEMIGWDWKYLMTVLKIGIPGTVSHIFFPFVYMFITRIPASYGPEYIAALRIGHTVEGLSFFLAMGFSMSVATCIGQNLGAKQPQRAAQAAWISAGMVAGVLAVLSVLFYLFSYQIGSVFTQDLQAISACDEYLKILAYSQVFMGLELVFVGAFSGAGDTMPPMVLLVPLNLARIPAAFLLEGISGMGISGVWWAISGSSILKGILIMIWFSRGGWKKKRI